MTTVFEARRTVSPAEIDELGHAGNIAYIQWMLDAAVAHSAHEGWPAERYRAEGVAWVVRSHRIEYSRPAMPGDKILVKTWVADMKAATSLRRYEIFREGVLLAKAATEWALIDAATRAPRRVPPALRNAFEVIP